MTLMSKDCAMRKDRIYSYELFGIIMRKDRIYSYEQRLNSCEQRSHREYI